MSMTEEPQQPSDAGGGSFKRPRTAWDVDVSLEKLMSWDVLEQFMKEFPDENSLLGGGGDGGESGGAANAALTAGRAASAAATASGKAAGGAAAPGALGGFPNIPLDSPFMCPPWPPGAMPDFFGGSMPPFQMPPQIFSAMSGTPFFAQPPPFFQPPPGAPRGGGFSLGAAGGEAEAGEAGGGLGAAGVRKGKAPKRARSGGAKGAAAADADAASGAAGGGSGGGGCGMRRVNSIESGLGEDADDEWAGGEASEKKAAHKQRFVWTAELHRRFEVAVNSLGIEHAKPQAISQLMDVEGCNAPTRQNIKSHLQKYRLLLQKRSKSAAAGAAAAGAAGAGAAAAGAASAGTATAAAAAGATLPPPHAEAGTAANASAEHSTAAGTSARACGGEGEAGASVAGQSGGAVSGSGSDRCGDGAASTSGDDSRVAESHAQLEGRLKKQELNLKVQLQLQAKLHRHLLMQRQLQHQLEVICHGRDTDEEPSTHLDTDIVDTPRGQATLALRNDLRQQLSKAVSMQQEMLTHLDSLVHTDGSPAAVAGGGGLVGGGGASVGGASAGGRRAGGVAADSFATLAHAGVGLGDADDLLFAEHVGGELGQEAGSEARGGGGGDGGGVSVDADADADALENFSIGDMLNENATGCADGDGES